MNLIVDTNVALDILQRREPFFKDAFRAVEAAIEADIACMFTSSAVTDVFYILRRQMQSPVEAKNGIRLLTRMFAIAEVKETDIWNALRSPVSDFEDAVVAAVAMREGSVCILTRNLKDFARSEVRAVSPAAFIKGLKSIVHGDSK